MLLPVRFLFTLHGALFKQPLPLLALFHHTLPDLPHCHWQWGWQKKSAVKEISSSSGSLSTFTAALSLALTLTHTHTHIHTHTHTLAKCCPNCNVSVWTKTSLWSDNLCRLLAMHSKSRSASCIPCNCVCLQGVCSAWHERANSFNSVSLSCYYR